jgi:hypothetical protein
MADRLPDALKDVRAVLRTLTEKLPRLGYGTNENTSEQTIRGACTKLTNASPYLQCLPRATPMPYPYSFLRSPQLL